MRYFVEEMVQERERERGKTNLRFLKNEDQQSAVSNHLLNRSQLTHATNKISTRIEEIHRTKAMKTSLFPTERTAVDI